MKAVEWVANLVLLIFMVIAVNELLQRGDNSDIKMVAPLPYIGIACCVWAFLHLIYHNWLRNTIYKFQENYP